MFQNFFLTLKFLCFIREVNTYTDPIKKRGSSISSSFRFHVEEKLCFTMSQSSYRLVQRRRLPGFLQGESLGPQSCHRNLCKGHNAFKSTVLFILSGNKVKSACNFYRALEERKVLPLSSK